MIFLKHEMPIFATFLSLLDRYICTVYECGYINKPETGTGINVKKGQLENQPKTGPSLEKNVLQRKRSKSKIRY